MSLGRTAMYPTGIEYPVGSGTYIDIDEATSAYMAMFESRSNYGVTVRTNVDTRRNTTGLLEGISIAGRTIPMSIWHDASTGVTDATFHNNVKRWFDPGKGRAGTRYLRIMSDDGSTQLRLPVHVRSLQPRPNAIGTNIYDVVFEAVTPYFEALTEDSDALTTAATIANDGNARAQVTIEIAAGTSISGNRYTITDDSGNGVVNYPIVINDTAPSTSQADSFVLVNGVSVPFTQGSTSAYYWLVVDLPASGTATVDILRNTTVTNPQAGTLDLGNIYTSGTTNASRQWSGWSIGSAPNRNGIWRATDVRIGWTDMAGATYGLTTDGTTSVFSISTITELNNDASAAHLPIGVGGGSLTNLSRVTAGMSSGDMRAYVRYRTATREWATAWSTTTNTTATGSITIPSNATDIVAGIEPIVDTATVGATATLTLSWSSTPGSMTLDGEPTVSSATATTWRLLDGTIENTDSGQTITFEDFIRRDGTLTIATSSDVSRRIQNSVDDAMLGSITFSDTTDLFSLDPGNNDLTESITGTVTVKHRATYL